MSGAVALNCALCLGNSGEKFVGTAANPLRLRTPHHFLGVDAMSMSITLDEYSGLAPATQGRILQQRR